jgi:membrane fusion protein, multidrug efflux system
MAAVLAVLGGTAAETVWGPWRPFAAKTEHGRPGTRRIGNRFLDVVPVLATYARRADVPINLDGVGTAKALNTVLVRPQVDGKLVKIAFTEGQEVPKGFVIAKIDPTIYQAQYDQAVAKKAQDEAQLANARLDLERYGKLLAGNAINKQQYDTQKALVDQLVAQVQSDQAAIDNAQAVLGYTDVTAPLAGLTGIRQVDEGNIVHATDTTGIVTITQIKPIAVLFNLPQQDLPDLVKGMAKARLSALAMAPDNTTMLDRGRVTVINNQVDPTTGTVQLKAEFPNVDVQLWPGQFINVRVLIRTLPQVVVVPTGAVQRGPEGAYVYVISDKETAVIRPVTLARQDDALAVIESGLQDQERVVTTGFGRLSDGSPVEPSIVDDAGKLVTNPPKGERKGERADAAGGATSATP